jgi:quercetin dioxygenase-like cupin family protein
MQYQLPHTIESGHGERIIFREIVKEADGDKLLVSGFCQPNAGPAMHVHLRQDEALTVVKGKMGYQILGQEPVYCGEGETVTFARNIPHRFWNAGEGELETAGWVKPADNIIFFLSTLYDAFKRGKDGRPENFDGAFLLTRYKGEYDMPEMPGFVKKAIIPLTYFVGRITGKYKKFSDAPEPLK